MIMIYALQYNQLKTNMTKIYSTTKVCSFDDPNKCDLSLDPGQLMRTTGSANRAVVRVIPLLLISDLKKIMKQSRNEKELRHAWTEWHNKCGNDMMKKSYERFVGLSNRVAHLNGL